MAPCRARKGKNRSSFSEHHISISNPRCDPVNAHDSETLNGRRSPPTRRRDGNSIAGPRSNSKRHVHIDCSDIDVPEERAEFQDSATRSILLHSIPYFMATYFSMNAARVPLFGVNVMTSAELPRAKVTSECRDRVVLGSRGSRPNRRGKSN